MDVEPCIELPPPHVRPADAESAQSRRRDDRGYGNDRGYRGDDRSERRDGHRGYGDDRGYRSGKPQGGYPKAKGGMSPKEYGMSRHRKPGDRGGE